MLITNANQADFLFQYGVRIMRIIKLKKEGTIGVLFDKYDKKFDAAMREWHKATHRN